MKDFAADYLVRPSAGGWKLRLEYRERSYEAMEEAFEAAVEAAHAAGKRVVPPGFLQAANGTWKPVWTYGLDPYPPRSTELFFGIAAH